MKGSVASGGIVHELLTRDSNYERWRVVMENYLQGKGLWDVVQSNASESVKSEASWKKKNAKALHIIQLSCGQQILDEISQFKTAKEAWDCPSGQYNLGASTDPQYISTDWFSQFKTLMFDKPNSDIYETTDSGWTMLHAVALTGDTRSVEWLVERGGDKLVGMADGNGYTALTLAAQYTGNAEIAKCLVERKNGTTREELLVMETKEGEIPVLLAAAQGHKELTTYLYSKTPLHWFGGASPRNRVFLLARCIASEIFGVALALLTRCPGLSQEALLINPSDFSTENLLRKPVEGNFSILDALANMPSAFPSGSRFGLLQQYIYDLVSVKREFTNSYDYDGMDNYPDFMGRVRQITRGGGVTITEKLARRWLPRLYRLSFLCKQQFQKLLGAYVMRCLGDVKYGYFVVGEVLQ